MVWNSVKEGVSCIPLAQPVPRELTLFDVMDLSICAVPITVYRLVCLGTLEQSYIAIVLVIDKRILEEGPDGRAAGLAYVLEEEVSLLVLRRVEPPLPSIEIWLVRVPSDGPVRLIRPVRCRPLADRR